MSDDAVATMAAVNGSLPVSTRDRERFTPDHYPRDAEGHPEPGAPVFVLAALKLYERRKLEHEWQGMCGRFVTVDLFRAAVRKGAIQELEPEDASRICGALDELERMEGMKNPDESVTAQIEQLQATVTDGETRVSWVYQPLRDLLRQRQIQLYGFAQLAVRACIRDWENLEAPCIRKGGLVTAECMMAVNDRDLEALETRCAALVRNAPDLEPDSVSP